MTSPTDRLKRLTNSKRARLVKTRRRKGRNSEAGLWSTSEECDVNLLWFLIPISFGVLRKLLKLSLIEDTQISATF